MIQNRKILFHTSLSPEEVITRVTESIKFRPKDLFDYRKQRDFYADRSKDYTGEVGSYSFTVFKAVTRNSFVPRVHGRVYKGENGAMVELRSQLHFVVYILFGAMLLFSGFLFMTTMLFYDQSGDKDFLFDLYFPIFFFLLFIFFGNWYYQREKEKTIAFLVSELGLVRIK